MDVQVRNYEKYNLKPEIRIGNYYFQWNAKGLGIDVHEINHLKNFIRKIIPPLEQYMVFLQNEKKNEIDKRDPYTDKKQICIREKYKKRISFLMFIDSQGSTFFYREESCDIVDNKRFKVETEDDSYSENSVDNNSIVTDHDNGHGDSGQVTAELKWLLGELLFDRKPQTQRR
jgi:hypothetical protein